MYKTYLGKFMENPNTRLIYLPFKNNHVRTNQLLFKVKEAQYQIKESVDEVSH